MSYNYDPTFFSPHMELVYVTKIYYLYNIWYWNVKQKQVLCSSDKKQKKKTLYASVSIYLEVKTDNRL